MQSKSLLSIGTFLFANSPLSRTPTSELLPLIASTFHYIAPLSASNSILKLHRIEASRLHNQKTNPKLTIALLSLFGILFFLSAFLLTSPTILGSLSALLLLSRPLDFPIPPNFDHYTFLPGDSSASVFPSFPVVGFPLPLSSSPTLLRSATYSFFSTFPRGFPSISCILTSLLLDNTP